MKLTARAASISSARASNKMDDTEKRYHELAAELKECHDLSDGKLSELLTSPHGDDTLFAYADHLRRSIYGEDVYIRGLIEFTNVCRNDCLYCGIRCSNAAAERYRLSDEQILDCCRIGHSLGYRTFVLQGGEDPFFTDEHICALVYAIRSEFPDCAVTLSIGEKPRASYQAYYDAGAERYLLRHETADGAHYRSLHPETMSLENRIRCLFDLKEIGFQVGSGFMVGSPYQTTESLIRDIRFLQELQPDMIGIGPYLTHSETPFSSFSNGSLPLTLRLIAMLRLLFPDALIPATTALGTIHPQGREMGLKAGANVVMPNLSPSGVRGKYDLYENKICLDEEAVQCAGCLEGRVFGAGYRMTVSRGDRIGFMNEERGAN